MHDKKWRIARWKQFWGAVTVLAALLSSPAGAATDNIGCAGSMEGNLRIKAGSVVYAGYDFMILGKHPALTVNVSGSVQVFEDCGTLTILLPPRSYTVAKDESRWIPSAEPRNSLVYQGSKKASCTGYARKGAALTASFVWSNGMCVRSVARFHYQSGDSGGAWSRAVVVSNRGECLSAPCACR